MGSGVGCELGTEARWDAPVLLRPHPTTGPQGKEPLASAPSIFLDSSHREKFPAVGTFAIDSFFCFTYS